MEGEWNQFPGACKMFKSLFPTKNISIKSHERWRCPWSNVAFHSVSDLPNSFPESFLKRIRRYSKKNISISAAGLEIVLQRPLWGQWKDAISQEKKKHYSVLKGLNFPFGTMILSLFSSKWTKSLLKSRIFPYWPRVSWLCSWFFNYYFADVHEEGHSS